jgi:hypothetical protein
VCGTKAGGGTVAGCQCPEHTGNDIFVDWVNGNDSASGNFPTGIDSPASCRFLTLGKGLSMAASGNRVVAKSTNIPADFASETFPLNVPANVTLTTADTVLTPANFNIKFNGGSGIHGVILANNSVFEGYTVQNAGGDSMSAAVVISGTGAIVDTVVLDGTGGGTTLGFGVGIGPAGQGMINNAVISGFNRGVGVQTTGAASTILNSTIDANAIGIDVQLGTLTATTVTINGGASDGVFLNPLAGMSATFNGSALTIKGMSGAGIEAAPTGGGAASFTVTSGDIGTNGGSGLLLTGGGSGTIGAVNVHDNTGAGAKMSGGSLTLGSGGTTTVQKNGANGATVTGGTLTLGAATLTNNTGDGVTLSGGSTLLPNTGASITSNTGNGISSTSSTVTFGGAAATPISVSSNGLDGILVSAGNLTANYVTLSGNGTGATKKSGLELSGAAAVNIGVASDAAVSVTGNGLDGVLLNGTTSGSTLDMRRASITSNGGIGVSATLATGAQLKMTSDTVSTNTTDGLALNLASGASATLTSLTVSGNLTNGIEIAQAPIVGGVVELSIDSSTISSNGGIGVWLHGAAGNIGASITNSKVNLNTGVGIQVQQGLATTTTETIQNDEVAQNGGGGIVFSTSSTLTSFQGNVVHGNTGDQITVSARQNGAGNPVWNFRSAGNACDVNRNQIYGYGGTCGTGVGLRVNSIASTTVDAQNVDWKNSAASAGTDYAVTGGNAVTATFPCTAVSTCP